MHGTSTRENRETLPMPDTKLWADRSRKVMSHNLDMNVGRESDRGVLPAKCPNKGGSSSPAEGMEGRPLTKENTGQMAASQMQSWGDASAGLRSEERRVGKESRTWGCAACGRVGRGWRM